jgi:hypothetical protein
MRLMQTSLHEHEYVFVMHEIKWYSRITIWSETVHIKLAISVQVSIEFL